MSVHHQNLHGPCDGCLAIFERYTGFSPDLRHWFDKLRADEFDAHISCAGRGKLDQEAAFARGASHAHYGQSAHNANAAIDFWQMVGGSYVLDPDWFERIIKPRLAPDLKWYGVPGSAFYELPHVELTNWRELLAAGELKLVE